MSKYFRIILDILIFLSILNGWWFIALPLAILGLWLYPYYIEIIIGGIMFDSLYGFIDGFGIIGFIGTFASIVIFILLIFLKKIVRK